MHNGEELQALLSSAIWLQPTEPSRSSPHFRKLPPRPSPVARPRADAPQTSLSHARRIPPGKSKLAEATSSRDHPQVTAQAQPPRLHGSPVLRLRGGKDPPHAGPRTPADPGGGGAPGRPRAPAAREGGGAHVPAPDNAPHAARRAPGRADTHPSWCVRPQRGPAGDPEPPPPPPHAEGRREGPELVEPPREARDPPARKLTTQQQPVCPPVRPPARPPAARLRPARQLGGRRGTARARAAGGGARAGAAPAGGGSCP